MLLCLAFKWQLESELRPSRFHGKHFPQVISLTSYDFFNPYQCKIFHICKALLIYQPYSFYNGFHMFDFKILSCMILYTILFIYSEARSCYIAQTGFEFVRANKSSGLSLPDNWNMNMNHHLFLQIIEDCKELLFMWAVSYLCCVNSELQGVRLVWWCMPIISDAQKARHEGHRFKPRQATQTVRGRKQKQFSL